MYSINFRTRTDVSSPERRVYVRIKVDGQIASDVSTPILVNVEKWDQVKQTVKGSTPVDHTNRKVLLQIKSDLIELITQNPNKSAKEIRELYVQKQLPPPSLLKTYQEFIDQEKFIWDGTPKELSKTTKNRWKNTKIHLHEFLGEDIPLTSIDNGFYQRFYAYLLSKPCKKDSKKNIGHDYAVRNVTYLDAVLKWANEKGIMTQKVQSTNGLKRNPPKPIQSLSREQLRILELTRDFTGILEDTRIVFLLMAYSSLNHCDLHCLESIKDQDNLVIKLDRQKNENRESEKAIVPIFPQLRKLLEKINYKIPKHHINVINRHCHVFEGVVGSKFPITTYIARKTAGRLLIDAGVSVDVVSKILGHKSIITTQRYYVTLREKNVLDGVKHLL